MKRLNYFDHQFLRAKDFNDEQKYHLDLRRLHNSLLHTAGIAEGLRVVFDAGATAVTVRQGTAIDSRGREIVLADDTKVELAGLTAGAAVFVTIAYDEQQTDPTNETGTLGNTRWTEQPQIQASLAAPADPGLQIALGRVTRSGTTVTGVEESVRRVAGAVGGDLTAYGLTLKRDGVDPSKWPKLSCSQASQAALTGGGLRLDAGTEILFQDNGQIRSLDNNHRLVFDRTNNRLELHEFGDIRFLTGGPSPNEKMRILGNGNVGIGTPSPDRGLTLSNTTGSNFLNVKDGTRELLMGVDGAGGIVSVMTNHDLSFRAGANAERMRIAAGGNVGVGTQAPSEKLQVEAGSLFVNGEGAGVIVDSGGAKRVGLVKYADREAGIWRLANQDFEIGRVSPQVTALPGSPTAFTTDLFVAANGRVGVGTAAPDGALDVVGTAWDQHLRLTNTGTGGAGPGIFFNAVNRDWAILATNATAGAGDQKLGFYDATAGAYRMVIDAQGEVGIGTTNPAQRLHVVGSFIRVDGAGNEQCYLGGDGAGNDVQVGSFNSGVTNVALWNATTNTRMNLFCNNIVFTGNLSGGGKGGYVMDQFVNKVGEAVEEGDVLVIGENQSGLYYGPRDNIPIPEVDIAATAYDTRVCGVVCEVCAALEADDPTLQAGTTAKSGKKAAKAANKPAPVRLRELSPEEMEGCRLTTVQPDQVGWMITLGAFAHCKVDADIAPIRIGDLLTTSPTKGHAQKVLERDKAVGAILGKALGSLDKGKGKIPVLLMLM